MAAGYERWWAPVLAPSAVALLQQLDAEVRDGATELLDVGVGTGNLSRPALTRWPSVRVTGVDASREMVGATETLLADAGDGLRRRFTGRVADAAEMPFEDRSFDAAMSSFVLQLVTSRPKALREIRRVLRPGGRLAYVTATSARCSRRIGSSTSCSTSSGSTRMPMTRDRGRATSRQWTGRSGSCGMPASATWRRHARCSTTSSRSMATSPS
jgi:ubiquinone/menaquinone biosynthesis C-methylase UbiE